MPYSASHSTEGCASHSASARSTASATALSVGLVAGMPVAADPFFFSTGNPDHLLGQLSRPPSPGNLETETADDFVLTDATVISRATVHGLIPSGLDVSSIQRVEVELYRIFPKDSDTKARSTRRFRCQATPFLVPAPLGSPTVMARPFPQWPMNLEG
jgi:hypothetical protein